MRTAIGIGNAISLLPGGGEDLTPALLANYTSVRRVSAAGGTQLYTFTATNSTDWDAYNAADVVQFTSGDESTNEGTDLTVGTNTITVNKAGVYKISFEVHGTITGAFAHYAAQIIVNDVVQHVRQGTRSSDDTRRVNTGATAILDLALNDVIKFGHIFYGDTGATEYDARIVHAFVEEMG